MKLNSLFSRNSVLQRDQLLPVWGWAEPGEHVSLTLAGQLRDVTADAEGYFRVTFDALPAGGPFSLIARGSTDELIINEILVGEVWLASGQSNMQWTVIQSTDCEMEMASANHPHIRMFNVPQVALMKNQPEVRGRWEPCSPQTVSEFSAVAYFFARELHKQLGGIPVGIINSSWGGTVAEAWISNQGLLSERKFHPMVGDIAKFEENKGTFGHYENGVKEWEKQIPLDPGDIGWAQGWAEPDLICSNWATMDLPALWQNRELGFSGILWFRREVVVPDSWAGRDLLISLGACDKSDYTWFNNILVGSIRFEDRADAWSIPRLYRVPGKLVKAGENTVAVRVFSHMLGGGMTGPKAQMYVALADDERAPLLPIAGNWLYRIERNFGQTPLPPHPPKGDGNPNTPTILFRSMISPLVPYALRGAIWYQGESNVDRAREYRTLFPVLIRDWRRVWGLGDFPFHFVQLANYLEQKTEPGESAWAELREAQLMSLKEPQTGMAVTIDIGDGVDIHPSNKQDVGRRLANLALAQSYGQEIVASGPLLRDWKIEGGSIRLYFEYAQSGLATFDGGPLRGFSVSGANRSFQWAWARIEGETVIVRNPAIPNPNAVRYAWADNPSCNLINLAGLPASPFRTDDWPNLTSLFGS